MQIFKSLLLKSCEFYCAANLLRNVWFYSDRHVLSNFFLKTKGQDFGIQDQSQGQDQSFCLRWHSRPRTSCKDYNTGLKCKNRRKLINVVHFRFINSYALCCCSRWPDTLVSVVTHSPRWGVSRDFSTGKIFQWLLFFTTTLTWCRFWLLWHPTRRISQAGTAAAKHSQ